MSYPQFRELIQKIPKYFGIFYFLFKTFSYICTLIHNRTNHIYEINNRKQNIFNTHINSCPLYSNVRWISIH